MSKTHVIDGKKYVEVDRKAEVGEKIMMVDDGDSGYNTGDIFEVTGTNDLGIRFTDNEGDDRLARADRYTVLEPLEDECCVDTSQASPQVEVDERDASPSVVDMLANLAKRLTTVEKRFEYLNDKVNRSITRLYNEVTDAKRDVEKLAQELATKTHELDDKIEMALDDIVTLDERTQFVGINTKSSAKLLAEAFEKLSRHERIGRR